MQLKYPIVFLDTETTGTNVYSDRIIEIAAIRLNPDGTEKKGFTRLNPGIPIPAEAVAIHKITDKDVADKPKFADVAEKLMAFLDGCDFAGYNIKRFDLPILEEGH